MIIVADSGSSKTSWAIVENNNVRHTETVGLNPFFISSEQLSDAIDEVFATLDSRGIQAIYFYGSGCGMESNKQKFRTCFAAKCPQAKVEIDTDLTGAAIALFGHERGIACILGTGANAGLYDGHKIIHSPKSLGYILGDTGSGAAIGLSLLKLYLHNKLPAAIARKLETTYNVEHAYLLENVYKRERPNRFFATYVPFADDHQNCPAIRAMLEEQFDEFFRYFIVPYPEAQTLPIRMIGSVALSFERLLKTIAEQHNIAIDQIVQRPIDLLVKRVT